MGEGLRVAAVLTSGAHALNGLYKDLLGKVQSSDGARRLNEQQQQNLAAALVPLARDGGLSRVDHLFMSRDGSKVFAVQGDPKSPASHMVSLEVASGSRQSVETSSQFATHNTANAETPAPAAPVTQSGRGF